MASAAKPLRLVFCGTPEFAVPTLAALVAAGHEVALVLTQPDRPSGRGMQLVAPPVKQWALAHGLLVEQPAKIRNNESLRAQLTSLAPDATIVVAYGRILPPWMLALPRFGNINLHGSLLPQYRGAAPIQWAVANGETHTGVTTMLLEEGLDTGPTLEHAVVAIPPDATAAELFVQLASIGAPIVLSTLAGLAAGTLTPHPQDHTGATYAPMLKRDDGRVDFSRPAQAIFNRWRGFSPWPGAWATLGDRKFMLTRLAMARLPPGPAEQMYAAGQLIVAGSGLYAACGAGTFIELLAVQLEGKRSTPAADFLRGHPDLAGTVLR